MKTPLVNIRRKIPQSWFAALRGFSKKKKKKKKIHSNKYDIKE